MSTGYTSPGSMIAISAFLPALDIIIVGLRFYTRRLQRAPLLLDDWVLIPGLIFTIAMGADIIVGVKGHGIGYPSPPTTVPGPDGPIPILPKPPEATIVSKVEWVSLWLQPLALGCIKISILAFYQRIFDTHKRGIYHTILKGLIGLTAAWAIAFFLALMFMCGTSFSNIWGSYVELFAECSNGRPLWVNEAFSIFAFFVSDFCLDILVFFLPLPKIWSLQMTTRRRLLVTFVFVVGALAIVGSIVRMALFVQPLRGVQTPIHSQDGFSDVTQFLFWSMIETGMAVIVTCLPTLNFLFGKFNAAALLHSIRSVLSLDLVRSSRTSTSEHSRNDQCTRGLAAPSDNESMSSQLRMIPSFTGEERQHNYGFETHIMNDLESLPEPPFGQVVVKNNDWQ